MKLEIDVTSHLGNDNYGRAEQWQRLCWNLVRIAFHLSPRPCWKWRNWLLRLFGAKLGTEVRFYPSVEIFFPWQLEVGDSALIGDKVSLYNLGPLRIGSNVIISQRTHLCGGTHNYHQPNLPLVRSAIIIGDHTWIAADAFVGPDVKIGPRSVVGARAVVIKSFEGNGVLAGNPAQCVRRFDS